jgi:hypothetical protein
MTVYCAKCGAQLTLDLQELREVPDARVADADRDHKTRLAPSTVPMGFIGTTVDQLPIRLWTLDVTDQPRALATFLAATAHNPSPPSGDRARIPNLSTPPEENSR